MNRSAISVIVVSLLTIGLLAGTLIAGNRPLLGLDLQGGVEIVLRPRQDPVNLERAADPLNMERAASIIRQRVDAIGVAEPDVTVQGTDIVVQLPGVEDQDRAIELVGQTAELRFRPVLLGPEPLATIEAFKQLQAQQDTGADGDDTGADGDDTDAEGSGDDTDAEGSGDDTDAEGSGDDTDAEEDGETEGGLGALVPGGESAMAAQESDDADTGDDDTEGSGDDTDAEGTEDAPELADLIPDDVLNAIPGINGGAGSEEFYNGVITSPEDDIADQSVVLISDSDQGIPQIYLLGPTVFTGSALEGAEAVFTTGWSVSITFLPGDEGIGGLNRAAGMCFNFTEACPQGQVAVVLDGAVQSQNGFQAETFTQREVTLSAGGPLGFEEEEARDTAVVLDFGALPLTFDDPAEAGLVRAVSATLGRSSLDAGIVAGAIGLALVTLYMLWVYGLLGLAAILSLVVSSSLLWVIVTYLSESRGLALTLAGIVGLIVAIGVSLDSNIVYFEQIKEYYAGNNGLRSSADRSFPESFRTVFWANLATLIGAIILYLLTIGSVRGFALMLGIASVLDLFATYFFMRPVVDLLVNSRMGEHPRWFGVFAPTSDTEAGA